MAKKTKPEAKYGQSTGADRCGKCKWYGNRTCEIVEGDIAPDMWCKFFAAKGIVDGPHLMGRHDDARRQMDRIKAR